MKKKQLALFAILLAITMMTTAPMFAVPKGGGNGNGGGGSKTGGKSKNQDKQAKDAEKSSAELEDLTDKLTLTDPQKVQVKSILASRDAEMAALKKEKLPKDEQKKKDEELKDETSKRIRAVLTPAQQEKFDGMSKKGGSKSGKKKKDDAPADAPAAPAAAAPADAPAPPTT